MNHKNFERQISAFVDNELSEQEANSLRTHVEGCPVCKKHVQELRTLRTSIREAASVVLPESFVYAVQRAVRREEQEYVIWLAPERFARNVVVALCILVAVMVGVGSYLTPQAGAGEDRYVSSEPADSAAHVVMGTQRELSKDDVMIAALTK